ncbi:uncharacterized protein LOC126965196 [Leptidea sinapis]|uniref:uncharacterized protein LOC126965196 n=1 Tax=Leptidea sinapis TaxID=189913 RepID=UPI0021C3ABD7|nr:uncharacterized protein LOC126965196 [Leptidea sinapis]
MNNFNDAIDFEDLFKVMVIAMRLSWSHPDVPRNLKWLFRFLLYHSIMTIIACLSAYSIIFHDIKYDISRACTNGIAVLIYFVVSFKYGLLVWHQHKFKTIIEQIKHDYKVAVSLPHKEYNVVLLYAQKGREVTHFWLKCSAAAILLFPVKSFALMSYYYIKGDFRYVAPLELALPNIFDPENNEVECFIAILILFSLTEIYVFCVYLSFSPLGPIAILHACGQLEIARMRSLNIFSQCDNRDDAKKIIKSVAKAFQEIYSFVDVINMSLYFYYEVLFKAGGVLFPVAVYQIIQTCKEGNLSIDVIAILIGGLVLCCVPCYFSDMLMEMSEKARFALYSCGWENYKESDMRLTLLILLTRTIQPVAIRTVFRNVCLDALTDIFHQSYAIFSLLNAVWV